MSETLLSLCIPTYQRAALLKECLDAVLQQWTQDLTPPQRSQIEIIVSDNASADDTAQAVERVRAAYPASPLTYTRQTSNIGADANVYSVMHQAAGTYLYVLADDDILLPGALLKLLSLIEQNPAAGAFCLNICAFTKNVSALGLPVFTLSKDLVIADPNDALEFLSTWITFLSIIAFRRDVLTTKDHSPWIGSNLGHACVFLDALLNCGPLWVTKEPLLAVRTDNTGGYSFFRVFVTQFSALLQYAEQAGYTASAVRRVRIRHLTGFVLPGVMTSRLRGDAGRAAHSRREGVYSLLSVYGPHPFVLGVVLPVMLMPAWILRVLAPLGRYLKGTRSPRRRD